VSAAHYISADLFNPAHFVFNPAHFVHREPSDAKLGVHEPAGHCLKLIFRLGSERETE
jgi:hypothetical protein